MRLIDAYKRGYLSEAEYLVYLNTGYTNDSMVDVTVDPYKYAPYTATMRLVKRDPNLLMELEYEIEGTGDGGKLQSGDTYYLCCSVDGRIMGYTMFINVSGTTALDIAVKTVYPPTRSESIVASAPPTVTTGYYMVGGENEVSTWDRVISAGDYIAIIVASSDLATRIQGSIILEPATQLNALV